MLTLDVSLNKLDTESLSRILSLIGAAKSTARQSGLQRCVELRSQTPFHAERAKRNGALYWERLYDSAPVLYSPELMLLDEVESLTLAELRSRSQTAAKNDSRPAC